MTQDVGDGRVEDGANFPPLDRCRRLLFLRPCIFGTKGLQQECGTRSDTKAGGRVDQALLANESPLRDFVRIVALGIEGPIARHAGAEEGKLTDFTQQDEFEAGKREQKGSASRE